MPLFLFALHGWCIRRRSLGPRLGLHRCVGQALATEAIAECIRSQSGERPGTCSGTALFEFGTVAANTSELFGSLEKSPLPALPFFLGC